MPLSGSGFENRGMLLTPMLIILPQSQSFIALDIFTS